MRNLDLWDKVCKTDSEYTKKVNQRGEYTSIAPQYQIKCVTEQFGSYGHGWGFESCDLSLDYVEQTGLVMVRAVFFYIIDGKKHFFPINNSWQAKTGSGEKARFDPDFAKKAETNTMSKALSKLGFSADVFLGEFDNPDYVEMVDKEFLLEKAEDKLAEAERQEAQHQEWLTASLNTIQKCGTMAELQGVFKSLVRKANLSKDDMAIKAFTKAKDVMKATLENKDV